MIDWNDGSIRVVAEAGQMMDGSLDKAIDMAWQASQAGAWGFKVQLLEPEKIAGLGAEKYWTDNIGTTNQREAFDKAGIIRYGDWKEVKQACDEFGIEFFATPFDPEAVEALEAINVVLYKIASGDITNKPLLQLVATTGKPIVLSTGASYSDEISRAYDWITQVSPNGAHANIALLACSLIYPCRPENANLNRITTLKLDYDFVGYSDHTTGTHTALAATALGATILEKHYTTTPNGQNVPDHAMAIDPDQLAEYVELAEHGQKLRGTGLMTPLPGEEPARKSARRSLHASRDIRKGSIFREEDLIPLRPGGGWEPEDWEDLMGCKSDRAYKAGEMITMPSFVSWGN